jgi:hypothetical protein
VSTLDEHVEKGGGWSVHFRLLLFMPGVQEPLPFESFVSFLVSRCCVFFAASLRRNFLRRHGVRRRDILLNFFLVVLTRRCRVSQLQKSRKKNVIMQRADKRKRKRRNDMW